METENFPYGNVLAEEIDGVMTVTSWSPGTLPERPEPEEEAPAVTLATLAADVETLKMEAEQAKEDRRALSILLTGEDLAEEDKATEKVTEV